AFIIAAFLVAMTEAHVEFDAGRFHGTPDKLLQFGARQFASVDRDGPGLAMTGGDDVLDHQQEDGSDQETFKIRSDKYRAVHHSFADWFFNILDGVPPGLIATDQS